MHLPTTACHLPDITAPPSASFTTDDLNSDNISQDEVLVALADLHNSRASGNSDLPAEYFRYAVAGRVVDSFDGSVPSGQSTHLLAPALSRLFAAAFNSASISKSWTTAIVNPIYKKADPTDTSNYRLVAIGVPLARLYVVVLHRPLSPYLGGRHLLADAQAGFSSSPIR